MPPRTNHYIYHEEPAPAGGFLSIIDTGGDWYRVGWREDRRRRWLSVEMWDHKFETADDGIAALPLLKKEFTLPEGTKINEFGDHQKKRVYNWERSIPGLGPVVPLFEEDHRAFAKHVFDHFDIIDPELTYYTPKRSHRWKSSTLVATCSSQGIKTRLDSAFGMSCPVLLHEYAHWIMRECYTIGSYASHGPEFVTVQMRLFNKFLNIPMLNMVTHAKLKRVKFAPKLNDKAEGLFLAARNS